MPEHNAQVFTCPLTVSFRYSGWSRIEAASPTYIKVCYSGRPIYTPTQPEAATNHFIALNCRGCSGRPPRPIFGTHPCASAAPAVAPPATRECALPLPAGAPAPAVWVACTAASMTL
eukprot:365754-Chlamydomonas_euryale.AAC.8